MDTSAATDALKQAQADGKLTESAVENIRRWLESPVYAEYAPQVLEHIESGKWQELDDAFWTIIPFGTGGRRGKMYPIGTNAINDRTIGESAQGLADYVREAMGDDVPLACAIAYDTRHRSRHFAELCAGIMAAGGYAVYFLDGHRSTPELSFAIRAENCSCGIMITASHNPPSDNAVKVYWCTGGQLLPPHDKGVIERVKAVREIQQMPFAEALSSGKVSYCQESVDKAYIEAIAQQRFPGPRDVKVLYSPLHGVGATAVLPALAVDDFKDVEVFGPHADPDGDFPNVPDHVANPENRAVFDEIIKRGQESSADLILATDPDCDRLGCAAPLTADSAGPWAAMTGNQIGCLLADHILEERQKQGTLSPEHYIVKTLVTTEMARRIAEHYGVKCHGNLLVGFKWIGGLMDKQDPDLFVFGTEESHGYLVGQYARDKDGAVAAMLLAEAAAKVKADGKSLHEKLDDLYWQFGYHAEKTISITMPGSEGMSRMQKLMARFRTDPPQTLAGLKVTRRRDYQEKTITSADGSCTTLAGPKGNMVILELSAAGNFIAVRPSGTEPKVKFYMFTAVPAEQLANLEDTKAEMADRLSQFEKELHELAETVH